MIAKIARIKLFKRFKIFVKINEIINKWINDSLIFGRSEDIFYIRNDYKYNIAVRPQKSVKMKSMT